MYIVLNNGVMAQDSNPQTPKKYFWIDAGLQGFGSPYDFGGAGVLAISYLPGSSLYTARFILTVNIPQEFAFNTNYFGTTELYEFGLLYGRALNTKYLFVSGSFGVSAVHWKSGVSKNDRITTIGLPLEVQAFLTPAPVLAFGIKYVVNINYKYIVTGGFVCVRFGFLREINP